MNNQLCGRPLAFGDIEQINTLKEMELVSISKKYTTRFECDTCDGEGVVKCDDCEGEGDVSTEECPKCEKTDMSQSLFIRNINGDVVCRYCNEIIL